jgi:hypothetical protein
LQHDNARPHTARATVATITDLHFDTLSHPPYSPDLAPSDYHMFGPLKEEMGRKKFRSDEEVHRVVHEWPRTRPQEFFPEEFVHFLCAGGSLLNVRETMSKNGTLVFHFYSINHM